MASGTKPLLSIVVPTMGNLESLDLLFESLFQFIPIELSKQTELIVYVNSQTADFRGIELIMDRSCKYLLRYELVEAKQIVHTAEESAFNAIQSANGHYLWIIGDQKRFLRAGVEELSRQVLSIKYDLLYFNSIWHIDKNVSVKSTKFDSNHSIITFKEFVVQSGFNYMATAMGCFVVKRTFYDITIWKYLIDKNLPHFSHVAILLTSTSSAELYCSDIFLTTVALKEYHKGSMYEWEKYSRIKNQPLYYPWAVNLAKLYVELIEMKVLTYKDLGRGIVSERDQVSRQVDEIYRFLVEQIRLGKILSSQKIEKHDFEMIMQLLTKASPERSEFNKALESFFYDESPNMRQLNVAYNELRWQLHIMISDVQFNELVQGTYGKKQIRLHPRGYLTTNDSFKNFKDIYGRFSHKTAGKGWELLDDIDLKKMPQYKEKNNLSSFIANSRVSESKNLGLLKKTVLLLMRFRITWILLFKMDLDLKYQVKAFLKF